MQVDLTSPQQQALNNILALRRITHDTTTRTTRAQGTILRSLSDLDLTAVASALEAHLNEFGW